jgi:hypothetical protein
MPVIAFLAGIAILGQAAPAKATLTLSLTDSNGGMVSISDLDGDGVLTFSGAVGGWIVNVTTALSKPVLGSPTDPEMDLNSVDVYGGGAPSDLTIVATDTDFALTPGSVHAMVGGTLGDDHTGTFSVSVSGGPTASVGPFGPGGAFSGSASAGFTSIATPYSMTLQAVLHSAGAAATSSSFDLKGMVDPVPEPATFVTALLGLPVGLLLVRRARRRLASA